MDQTESDSQNNNHNQLSSVLKHALIITNSLLMLLGYVGGSVTSRIYFLHGGHRRWLSSLLETAGFPILLLPLSLSYFHQTLTTSLKTKLCHPNIVSQQSNFPKLSKAYLNNYIRTNPRVFFSCAAIGLMTGLDDFLYSYGLSFLPVSTSVLLLSSHLAFTAFFAFLIVKQKFTAFSINAVVLLTVGPAVMGLHAGSDRPDGVSERGYYLGFGLTVAAAALYGLILPLIEVTCRKVKGGLTYRLVMEMQFVMGFFASVFCLVGMVINKDFQAIREEAANYGLGETKYYVVIILNAILWQCFYLGTVGVIFSANTLLAAIIIAVCVPVTGVSGALFLHERFSSEKVVSLLLALWGLISYTYGEYSEGRQKRRTRESASTQRSLNGSI